MIQFEKLKLSNGMRLLIHEDHSTPLAAVNIMYNVGARDEDENRTGFAHLFEHLMFGGSKNVPVFDEPLQQAGGENNAFTSNDITNYYETLPAQNLETALWLESDRLMALNINQHTLDVQRKVVCEEFKEHYINQPYGDAWHLLRELAYKKHPYKWPTIGKNLNHVEEAQLSDVQAFFKKHYVPANAIMVIAGNIKTDEAARLAEKWFGGIAGGEMPLRKIGPEPKQTEARFMETKADVPADMIYKAYHMDHRLSAGYYQADVLSDILSGGKSGRLFQQLVMEQKLFSEINAFHTGSIDPGLFVIEGKLLPGVKMETAETAITVELKKVCNEKTNNRELDKVKNQIESSHVFGELELLNRALNIAFGDLLGNANLINEELETYRNINSTDIQNCAQEILTDENCSTLYYLSNKN